MQPGKFDLVYENADGSESVEYAVARGSRVRHLNHDCDSSHNHVSLKARIYRCMYGTVECFGKVLSCKEIGAAVC